jgi:hypothetical protein
MHQKCQKYFLYLIEDDDQEEDIERGTRQTDVGEVVEKFKHFDHVLFQVRIHLTNRRKITKFLSYQQLEKLGFARKVVCEQKINS